MGFWFLPVFGFFGDVFSFVWVCFVLFFVGVLGWLIAFWGFFGWLVGCLLFCLVGFFSQIDL